MENTRTPPPENVPETSDLAKTPAERPKPQQRPLTYDERLQVHDALMEIQGAYDLDDDDL